MSISQTYYLAHAARGKLSSEAARNDHNLRLLVGHANLLDTLTLEIQDAERTREAFYNQAIRGSPKQDTQIGWSSAIIEEEESENMTDYEAEPDSDDDEEDFFENVQRIVKMAAAPFTHDDAVNFMLPPCIDEGDEDEDEVEDDEQHMEGLSLARVPSHSSQPPELIADSSDDSSDDDSTMSPPASPAEMIAQGIITMDFGYTCDAKPKDSSEYALYQNSLYIAQRSSSPMIAAC